MTSRWHSSHQNLSRGCWSTLKGPCFPLATFPHAFMSAWPSDQDPSLDPSNSEWYQSSFSYRQSGRSVSMLNGEPQHEVRKWREHQWRKEWPPPCMGDGKPWQPYMVACIWAHWALLGAFIHSTVGWNIYYNFPLLLVVCLEERRPCFPVQIHLWASNPLEDIVESKDSIWFKRIVNLIMLKKIGKGWRHLQLIHWRND